MAAAPHDVKSSGGGGSSGKPCIFFMKGFCKAGSKCPFLHSRGLPPPASINEQCRYGGGRGCKEGNKCPFLHGPTDKRVRGTLHKAKATMPPQATMAKPSPVALAAAQRAAAAAAGQGDEDAQQPPPPPMSTTTTTTTTTATATVAATAGAAGGGVGRTAATAAAAAAPAVGRAWNTGIEPGTQAVAAAWGHRFGGEADQDLDDYYFYGGAGAFPARGAGPSYSSSSSSSSSSSQSLPGPAPAASLQWSGKAWASVASIVEEGASPASPAAVDPNQQGGIHAIGQQQQSVSTITTTTTTTTTSAVPCRFHSQGLVCRFGAACRFSHGAIIPPIPPPVPPPQQQQQQQQHPTTPQEPSPSFAPPAAAAADDAVDEVFEDLDTECGICFSEVEGSFGLLDGCSHAFCLGCIRSWREAGVAVNNPDASTVRRCPVCRLPCHLVVPSPTLPRSRRATEGVVAGYKAALAAIPCRHFAHDGRAVTRRCPFGSSCLYAHLKPDGTPAPAEAPRLRVNADGAAEAVGEVRLSHFLEQQARFH